MEQERIKALKNVAKIAKEINKAVSTGVLVRTAQPCPHGNFATAPYNHPWFCDNCWNNLQVALNELDEIERVISESE